MELASKLTTPPKPVICRLAMDSRVVVLSNQSAGVGKRDQSHHEAVLLSQPTKDVKLDLHSKTQQASRTFQSAPPVPKTHLTGPLVHHHPSTNLSYFGYRSNDYYLKFLPFLGGVTKCALLASPPNPTKLKRGAIGLKFHFLYPELYSVADFFQERVLGVVLEHGHRIVNNELLSSLRSGVDKESSDSAATTTRSRD
ncbi:hypothetical protein M5K25_025442 [Dendrobium thyrsiflorum]|uniref:Uncharacterized protein n=1 Tax=Dendrobium thyrsiflorum TaxID=117978 RepID=A0ABD0U933_DENTH